MAEILHQLRLVVCPYIFNVLAPSQVVSQISAINSMGQLHSNSFLPLWQVHLECEGAKAADPPKWRVKFAEAEDEADNAGVLWMTSLGEDSRFVLWCAL